MTALQLRDLRTARVHNFNGPEIRIGRDLEVELTVSGDDIDMVSALHVRIVYRDESWWVQDAGSRNGTFFNERRMSPEASEQLTEGAIVGLGQAGPRFRVERAGKRNVPNTVPEAPRVVAPGALTEPMRSIEQPGPVRISRAPAGAPGGPTMQLVVVEQGTGERFELGGGRVRIGRGSECELNLVGEKYAGVSRVHCEIVLKPSGQVVARDAKSRNGTLINGKPLTGEHKLKRGDRLSLGRSVAHLVIDDIRVTRPGADEPVPAGARAAPGADAEPAHLGGQTQPRVDPPALRSFGGKGKTQFVREVVHQAAHKGAARGSRIVWALFLLVAGGLAALYWYSDRIADETRAQLEAQQQALAAQQQAIETQRAVADSIRTAATADYERVRVELD